MMLVDQFLAEAEIAKLLITYPWALDSKDVELITSLFASDARFDLSEYGVAPVVGKAALRTLYTELFSRGGSSFSSFSNVRINVEGDTATGADYFMHYDYPAPGASDPKRPYVEGQHFYTFVKEGGAWKISSMRVHIAYRVP